jgi:hypothetical protein
MINSLFILALLTVVDPASGPAGVGDLTPPTAAVYRNLSVFDLQEIMVLKGTTVQLEVKLGSFSNPYNLPLGFSHPVVDIYLGGGEHGTAELLPGHGMRLPEGELWSVAFRLTGDNARGYRVLPGGEVEEFTPEVTLAADRLSIGTDIPVIDRPRLAALVGLYDPFQETGWRPLANQPNAWAFSAAEQVFPVLDILAIDEAAQTAALASGILPVTEASSPVESKTLWLLLMASGIGVAGTGLLLRSRTGRDRTVILPEPALSVITEGEIVPVDEARPEAALQTRGASPDEIEAARARLAEAAGASLVVEQQDEAGTSQPEADWELESWLLEDSLEADYPAPEPEPAVSDSDAPPDEDAG